MTMGLAADARRLEQIRRVLLLNRWAAPLFDTVLKPDRRVSDTKRRTRQYGPTRIGSQT
jgi:hypothetical protein